MRRYFEIFRIFFLQTIKTEIAYRSQVLQRFFGIVVSLSVTVFFWIAASKASKIGTYTTETILFYFIIAGFHDFLFISGDEFSKKIGDSIRSGKLSAALVQPFPYLLKICANGCGGVSLRLCLVIPLGLLIRFTVLKDFVFENPSFQVGFYLLALFMAVFLSMLCLIITGMFAFDMTQVWAPWVCFVATYCLLSGIFYPADQATGVVKLIMNWLPFYYMVGFPSLILIGRLGAHEVYMGFAYGLFAMAYLSLILALMWRRGIKKFEAIGI